jgi:putative FmdB family regulatory protein
MPLYDYKCTACGKITEIRHGFGESHADPCPACGATLVRVFNPAPIVFKGSGFYVTDSRAKASSNASKAVAKSDAKPEASGEQTSDASSGGAEKTDSKASDSKARESKAGDSKASDSAA